MKRPEFKRLDPNTVVIIKQIIKGVLALSLATLLVVGVWHGTRIQTLTISDISVEGGETINHGLVRDIAEGELEGLYLGLVPRRFAWFYPAKDIVEQVELLDRVHDVKVGRVGGSRIEVSFDEHIPSALWCGSEDKESCLFLNNEGYAFASAPALSGGNLLRFEKVGQTPALHEFVMEKTSMDLAGDLIGLLRINGWVISWVEIGQDDDLFLSVVGGGELKVNLNQAPEETLENLLIILASDEFSHLQPGNFQYIDLRFGKKVYVNEEPATLAEEVAGEDVASTSVEQTD